MVCHPLGNSPLRLQFTTFLEIPQISPSKTFVYLSGTYNWEIQYRVFFLYHIALICSKIGTFAESKRAKNKWDVL